MKPKICENCTGFYNIECENPESIYFGNEVSPDFSCLEFIYNDSLQ